MSFELLVLVAGVALASFVVYKAFKRYEATKEDPAFSDIVNHVVEEVKTDVKDTLDVNNDGKVDVQDVKEAAKQAAKKAKKTSKKVSSKATGAVKKAGGKVKKLTVAK